MLSAKQSTAERDSKAKKKKKRALKPISVKVGSFSSADEALLWF